MKIGDDSFSRDDVYGNVNLISAFSDNEGIIFITRNEDTYNFEQISTIRFHRIYRNNWFFLGRYTFKRRNIEIKFTGVFMFQGQFYLYENVNKCLRGFSGHYCFELITLPPKIHLLDRVNDEFVEQIMDINNQNYDFFEITV